MSEKFSLLIVSNQNHSLLLLISFCKVEKLQLVMNSFLNLGTLEIEKLESQIILKVLRASKPKGLNRIAKTAKVTYA